MSGNPNIPYELEQAVCFGAGVVVQREQWKLVSGCNSVGNKYFPAVGDNAFAMVLLKVGAFYYVDVAIEVTAGGMCLVNLYKNPFIDADGSAVLLTNPNDSSTRNFVGSLSVHHTPTIGSGGNGEVMYPDKFIPGASNPVPFTLGMKNGLNGLWRFNLSTNYLIVLQNKSGGAANFSIELTAVREKY